MIQTFCDHCKKRIREVAYALFALDADRVDWNNPMSRVYLHWECVPRYGRTDNGEPK